MYAYSKLYKPITLHKYAGLFGKGECPDWVLPRVAQGRSPVSGARGLQHS